MLENTVVRNSNRGERCAVVACGNSECRVEELQHGGISDEENRAETRQNRQATSAHFGRTVQALLTVAANVSVGAFSPDMQLTSYLRHAPGESKLRTNSSTRCSKRRFAAPTAMDRLVAVRVALRAEGKVLFQWRA